MDGKDKFERRLKRSAGLPSGEYGQLEPVDQLEPCPKCEGEVIEANVHILLAPVKFGLNSKTSGVEALVCTNCGYTEFYAKKPLNLVVKRPDKQLP